MFWGKITQPAEISRFWPHKTADLLRRWRGYTGIHSEEPVSMKDIEILIKDDDDCARFQKESLQVHIDSLHSVGYVQSQTLCCATNK